jgi:hypothetical protein
MIITKKLDNLSKRNAKASCCVMWKRVKLRSRERTDDTTAQAVITPIPPRSSHKAACLIRREDLNMSTSGNNAAMRHNTTPAQNNG